jgi:phosphotransacetylase
LLSVVLDKKSGLYNGQLLSDVMVVQYNGEKQKLLMITDGGVVLLPTLKEKIEIIRNAIVVAHALGIRIPKIAVLSAVETVTSKLPSTLDAAILTKMNERGQIGSCIIDGPLALDNALSSTAAKLKKLSSSVAGNADVLLCPNIEAGNLLGKSTTYLAKTDSAHVLIGAKVPILIPSRSDDASARLRSMALGKLVYSHLNV